MYSLIKKKMQIFDKSNKLEIQGTKQHVWLPISTFELLESKQVTLTDKSLIESSKLKFCRKVES